MHSARLIRIAAFILVFAPGTALAGLPKASDFFNSLRNLTIEGANRLDALRGDADKALRKKVSDFASCPSPDAQTLYDDLKQKRDLAFRVRNDAQKADDDAKAARDKCLAVWPNTNVSSPCSDYYSYLPFANIKDKADKTIVAIDNARAALKALRCVTGCNRSTAFVYPMIDVGSGSSITPSGEVCVEWAKGSFDANFDSGNGEIAADVRAKLPKCNKTLKVTPQVCAEWDTNVILPRLVAAKIVPAEVKAPDLSIKVPSTNVKVVGGFNNKARCSQPVNPCTRAKGSLTINFDTRSNPLQVLSGVAEGNCAEHTTIGCALPPFSLEPTYTKIQVPDLRNVKISWTGPSIKAGEVVVDVSKGKVNLSCKKMTDLKLPTPLLNVRAGRLESPLLCLEPRLGPLVANP